MSDTKVCSKCNQKLPVSSFNKSSRNKDGIYSSCKECRKKFLDPKKEAARKRKWVEDNKEKHNENCRLWAENNYEKRKQIKRNYYEKNKDKIKKYNEKKKEERNKYEREKRKNSPKAKLSHNMRVRIRDALKGRTKSARTFDILGCSIEELLLHLESQFTEGMTWDNYGDGWHVDHIRPCCSYDFSSPEQQKECFNYNNLQPLWAEDNLRKSGKWVDK